MSLISLWIAISIGVSPAQTDEINQLLQSGRFGAALGLLEPLAKKSPDDAVVLGLLGRARLHAGDARGAIAPLKRSLLQLKNDAEGFNNLGVAWMQLKRTAKAAQAFARAVVLQPRSPQAWRNLAGAYTHSGRGEDARKAWAHYISFVPSDAEARCVYGGVLLDLKRPRLAAVHLRAGSAKRQDPVCFHDYADALGRLGEQAEALKILDRLVLLDRSDAHAQYLRAYILVERFGAGAEGVEDGALQAIEVAINLAPKRASYQHLHGHILSRLKRHEDALKAFGRARDLKPKVARYRVAEAIARVRVGEGERALSVLRRIVRADPGHIEAGRALAHVHMEAGRWAKARRALRGVASKDVAAAQDLAIIALQSGHPKEAVERLTALTKAQPKRLALWQNLALAQRRMGRMEEALGAIRHGRALAPTSEEVLLQELRILLELGRAQEVLDALVSAAPQLSYALLFVRARALRERARLPEAVKAAIAAERSASSDEQRDAARRLRGKVLTDFGRSAEAIGLFSGPGASPTELGIALSRAGRSAEAISVLLPVTRKGDDPEAHAALAAALQDGQQKKRARRVLERAHKRWPEHPGLINDLSLAWLDTGAKTKAVALLKRGVEAHPAHSSLARNYGRYLLDHRRRREAIKVLRRATSLRPHDGRLHTALGEALVAARRIAEASNAFRQALAAGTPDPEAHAQLGDLARHDGRLIEAISAYKKAIAARPGMLMAYNGYGMTLHGLERYEEAIAIYRKGLAHARADPELNNNLGSTLYMRGRFPDALTHFQRAAEARPLTVAFWRNQVMVLKEQGRLGDAQKVLIKALKLLPKSSVLKNEAISLKRAKEIRDRMAQP